jgi:hypothetical protein
MVRGSQPRRHSPRRRGTDPDLEAEAKFALAVVQVVSPPMGDSQKKRETKSPRKKGKVDKSAKRTMKSSGSSSAHSRSSHSRSPREKLIKVNSSPRTKSEGSRLELSDEDTKVLRQFEDDLDLQMGLEDLISNPTDTLDLDNAFDAQTIRHKFARKACPLVFFCLRSRNLLICLFQF